MLNGNRLIISSHWDSLTALDKATGKKLWANKDEDIRFRSSTPAVIDENTLLVADSDAIMTVDATNGEIINKTDNTGYNFATASEPLINGSTAYITTADKGVVAYSLETNSILGIPRSAPAWYILPLTQAEIRRLRTPICFGTTARWSSALRTASSTG